MKSFWIGFGVLVLAIFALLIFNHYQPLCYPTINDTRSFIAWLGDLFIAFSPWPILIFALLLIKDTRDLIRRFGNATGELIKAIMQRGGSIDVGGLIKIQQQAKEHPDTAKLLLSAQLNVLTDGFQKEMSRLVRELKIIEDLERLFSEVFLPELKMPEGEYEKPRCTLHMKDPLFVDSLYQLTNYVPKKDFSIQKDGRRFSTRHGIIGQSWRQEDMRYDPDVKADDNTKLIDTWGFTKETAGSVGYNRRTFFAYPLLIEGEPAFILYFDAGPTNVLGDTKEKVEISIKPKIDKWISDNPHVYDKLAEIYGKSKEHDPIIEKKFWPL